MKIETRKVIKLSGITIVVTVVTSASTHLTTRFLTREVLEVPILHTL